MFNTVSALPPVGSLEGWVTGVVLAALVFVLLVVVSMIVWGLVLLALLGLMLRYVSVPVPVLLPVLVRVLARARRHVRVRWRLYCAERLLARVLSVTHPGEHRALCGKLFVPLKRHCRLAHVHVCRCLLVCVWRQLCTVCLRLRVRVQSGACGSLAQCTLVARVVKQLAVHLRFVALPIALPLLSPIIKT